MNVIPQKVQPSSSDTASLAEKVRPMPRISRTTLGIVGLAIGVGVGLFVLRNELPRVGSRSTRRRLERAALELVAQGARNARRLELPSASSTFSAFERDGSIGRLFDRWRD